MYFLLSKKGVGVCRFSQKMCGNGFFFLKNGWEWVVIVEKWVGVGRFSWKMGRRGLFFLKNGYEWVVFVKKWVGGGCFSWKMNGSGREWLGAQFGKALLITFSIDVPIDLLFPSYGYLREIRSIILKWRIYHFI